MMSSQQSSRLKNVFMALLVLLLLPFATHAQEMNFVDNFRAWSLADYEAQTGTTMASFQEAPALAALVNSGALPAVTERLPERQDILVVQPREQVGQYGGEITYNASNPMSFGNTGFTAIDQRLLAFTTNWEEIIPNLAKSVELSEDLTTATVILRRGVKWSDGVPLTSADILFWYESIMLHPELPNLPSQLTPGGKPVAITQVDDYTVEFGFASPNPGVMVDFALTDAGFPIAPRHYLEQFHADFNEDAEQLARDAGFETWTDYFLDRYAGQTGDTQVNPELPVLKPWTLESIDTFGNKVLTRNPYYWKVDVEGNQLPYIDSQVRLLVSDPQVVILRVQAGEIDYGFYNLTISDLPVLRAGESEGNYTTILWPAAQGAMNKYQFNITVNDAFLNELFNDIRFRQAMSLAINRAEINQTLFFGLARERQWGVPSASAFYEEWMGEYYADYDPDQANALLDDLGLSRGADGMRQRPDGSPLTIVLWDAINQVRQSELVAEYWKAVGINVNINPSSREAFQQALLANEVHASVWFADVVFDLQMYRLPIWLRPPYGIDATPVGGGLAWRQWWLSGGEQGSEPPDSYYTEQMQLVDEWQQTEVGSADYLEIGIELVRRTVERMLHIGTVGEAPEVFIRSNRLQNFPPEQGTIYINHLVSGHADQWFVNR